MSNDDDFKSKYRARTGYKLCLIQQGIYTSSGSPIAAVSDSSNHRYKHPLETQEMNFLSLDDLIGFIEEMFVNMDDFIKEIENMKEGDLVVKNRVNEGLGDTPYTLTVSNSMIVVAAEDLESV